LPTADFEPGVMPLLQEWEIELNVARFASIAGIAGRLSSCKKVIRLKDL